MQRNTIISLVIAVVVIAGAWYFFSQRSDIVTQPVAVVDGTEITQSELELTQNQVAAEQSIDTSTLSEEDRVALRDQALDVLISRTLLFNAVENSGITISDAEVETQLNTIREQFESEEAFNSALSAEGLTEESLASDLRRDLAAQAYFNQELNFDSLTASEAEIEEAYNTAIQGAEDAPPLAEVRGQVEDLVIGQKQQTLIAAHLQELRAEADIEILI